MGRLYAHLSLDGRCTIARLARPRLVARADRHRFIYAQIRRTNDGAWRNYLPRRKYRRGRHGRRKRSADDLIKGRVPVALRPPGVVTRRLFGHWESDSMAFAIPGQAALVAIERKSRLTLGARRPGQASHPVAKQLRDWFKPLDRRLRRSITIDNGTEFAQHLILTNELDVQTFFCDPHSPWQKGRIENASADCAEPCQEKPTSTLSTTTSSRLASPPTTTRRESV